MLPKAVSKCFIAFNLRAAAKKRQRYAASQWLFAMKGLFSAIGRGLSLLTLIVS